MKSIAYLIDDGSLGGVSRTLTAQIARLDQRFRIEQTQVRAQQPLPPHLEADAVFVHFSMAWSKLPFLTLLRAQHPQRPMVLVEHNYCDHFERHLVPNVPRFRSMLRLSYRLFDKVVCVSDGQARWMRKAQLVPIDKLVVIRSASDTTHLMDIPEPAPVTDRPLRLAAYGRYTFQKGFDVLVDAMRMIAPEDATLTFAGYGEDEAELRLAASGLPHVKIGTTVEDLRAYLSSSDAVIVPSRWEPFGLVAVEARAAARPIIVSDLDGLREQASPHYGAAVTPDDPRALADAILKLRGADLAAMGRAARLSVASHFDDHIRAYGEWLESLANQVPESALMSMAH